MKPYLNMKINISLVLIIMLSMQYGCSTSDQLRADSEQTVSDVSKAPKSAPYRTVTNFTNTVRCMDNLLSDYGVKGISVLVEDLDDNTKKVSVGTRDMLLSTMSEMTRRSRAIKFISYGGDQKNIVSFMAAADVKSAFASVPQYDIRGSISQFDDNVVKNTQDIGVGFTDYLTLGKSASSTAKILGIDLSVINTSDLSLVPGVYSKNAVAIFSQGDGIDSEARYNKFGLNYSTSLAKSEGTAVAVRNLIELASVELMGKLTKVPYWKCMSSNTKNHDVKVEVEDWFEGMANNPAELFAYFQYQLANRGVYKGLVNGVPTPQLSVAIKQYKTAMGLPSDSNLNTEFLAAYLDADHDTVAKRIEKMNQSHNSRAPIKLTIAQSGAIKTMYAKKENVRLELSVEIPAYVYCYLFDPHNTAMRIYPNRFSTNPFLDGETPLKLPDSNKFKLIANENAQEERISCYGTHKDVLQNVAEAFRGTDLAPLGKSVTRQSIYTEFAKLNGDGIGITDFTIRVDPKSK